MDVDIREELDPIFETMGLIYVSCHAEKQKTETMLELPLSATSRSSYWMRERPPLTCRPLMKLKAGCSR